jgi:D-tyrosyl-tRNA(Tyr) deacylase
LKALLQRVAKASVSVAGEKVGHVGSGLAILLGVASDDEEADASYLADRVLNLRKGELLLVSQFTLLAATRKGRRPSFDKAAGPQKAAVLFEKFVEFLSRSGLKVETGRFQQHMMVEIHNDGPVTIMLDSKERFLPRQS